MITGARLGNYLQINLDITNYHSQHRVSFIAEGEFVGWSSSRVSFFKRIYLVHRTAQLFLGFGEG
jgi:hypothetical protein